MNTRAQQDTNAKNGHAESHQSLGGNLFDGFVIDMHALCVPVYAATGNGIHFHLLPYECVSCRYMLRFLMFDMEVEVRV